jgi:hypothetical protein
MPLLIQQNRVDNALRLNFDEDSWKQAVSELRLHFLNHSVSLLKGDYDDMLLLILGHRTGEGIDLSWPNTGNREHFVNDCSRFVSGVFDILGRVA